MSAFLFGRRWAWVSNPVRRCLEPSQELTPGQNLWGLWSDRLWFLKVAQMMLIQRAVSSWKHRPLGAVKYSWEGAGKGVLRLPCQAKDVLTVTHRSKGTTETLIGFHCAHTRVAAHVLSPFRAIGKVGCRVCASAWVDHWECYWFIASSLGWGLISDLEL